MVMNTTSFEFPEHLASGVFSKVQDGSVVAALSGRTPMLFGRTKYMSFDSGEAEYVGEGQNKSSQEMTASSFTVEPFKFQKTFRFTDELKWADEDTRLGAIKSMAEQIPGPLARALDFGVIHGVNPLTGEQVDRMRAVSIAGNATEVPLGTAGTIAALDAAEAKVMEAGYLVDGVALDTKIAAGLRQQRDKDGRRLYPDFTATVTPTQLDAFRVSTSGTVSGARYKVASGLSAVVGDWSKLVWGVQRQIGLHTIEYGDPDGNGDLQRNNQIAIRAEIVYGWAVADEKAFSVVGAPIA